MRLATTIALSIMAVPAQAHGFGGSGWLHPLTGPDHMLAMIAVGAWSAQMGGRALWTVPSAFLLSMAAGGALGFAGLNLPGTEIGIALSVLLLGTVVLFAWSAGWPVAAIATLIFGFSHGMAHGVEIHTHDNPLLYELGFLTTTAGLHVVGLVGGLLLLESSRGAMFLRGLGACTVVAGIYFAASGL
ncbi:HupE/UreJ family protein [Devosia algicola]|uniref:HupE/UreJ family protein n=1 Tax=Devosia algicola TaxID=3026418 RepID=A0ABY7YKP2_9HYPH|nr:HupE/UreJ family protein [Devosia algicola]WDR01757.1 HupE/UreJ family protein [Devosia algicola]